MGTLNRLLNDVILDYTNSEKIYKLAREYDKLQQGAAATGFYLRAADMSPGSSFEEKWLQYKSIILTAFIYDRNGNRDISTSGLLKLAVETMPERPEAYYFLAKFYQYRENWLDSLTYSRIGVSCLESPIREAPDNDFEYPGGDDLRLVYARAKWKTDGRDATKNLLFDLKYKGNLSPDARTECNELLEKIGYPSTLAFTQEESHKYKYPFPGIENIKKNYSRHFQDMFVLSLLDGKKNGTFVEIGSGHPELFNNTLLLEKEFGWKGISIDNSERMCYQFSRNRSTSIILANASEINYGQLFKQSCLEPYIDFLRINAEGASIEALKKIPFDNYKFATIQFQHNACWWGDEFRQESRKILSKVGYILHVPDVAVNEKHAYEDWWVHPALSASKRNMKAPSTINFAWNYMMRETKK